MLEIDRFYNRSHDIAFEKEDLRAVYVMNGLRILQNSSNISHKTSVSIRGCRVNQGFFSDCFRNLAGNKFVDTMFINDIIPDEVNWAGPLCEYLSQNTRIRRLDLSGSKLGITDIEQLSQAIIANEVIETLDISRTPINKQSVNFIANMIMCNNSLVSLSMRSNSMTPTDLNILASVLHLNKSLKSLCISDSRLNKQVALTLSTSLHSKDSVLQLERIDISYCCIDDAIIECLVLGLRRNQSNSLQVINLMGNSLTDESIAHIIEMANWPKMREIILTGNKLTGKTITIASTSGCKALVHF